ncbi:FCD domain-containing protein [Rhizobium pusense]|uniref:Pyruvate dehydrogenase complex repressor n=1 Tax=Agrobacterium genomosp. 2 str. CFBP 5494 TaxID=1183436 RepID=A0A9W5F179_9HYPH|nr:MULTISPECIES: FCD domain-containing protein [Rhizobium/Agrobacterium group]MDH0912787.1 FCD domain-containing protein [Agrobacterium pusense]MDH1099043.1 FCD domain-containing protein [Agrobacterium pusense]MDH1115590.1 FCD domain-containing protein [Agrobacterium pusense]MDH2197360.1 FCD domain-containing protein [Agrobacterium pusense]OJH55776.1 hypothetical protein ATN81_06855 [Agrobacterium pusense]
MRKPELSTPDLTARIEAMIIAGSLAPGDRLPAERQLAAEMGASRSKLREAIKQLASRGVVISRQGGGTYVAAPEEVEPVRAVFQSLAPLARNEAGYWRDVMEIRKSLEGDVAAFAAMRADAEDIARISTACDAVGKALLATDPQDAPLTPAKLDVRFHMAIAQAAKNAVLYQIMTGLETLLASSMADSLTHLYRLRAVPAQLDAQHRRIMSAITAGQSDAARTAAIEHLLFVESQLENIERDAARQKRSSHALQHINPMKEKQS